MKKLCSFLLLFLGGLAALAGYTYKRLKRSLPTTDGELKLSGLSGPVDVTFDRAGIPHIKAETDGDGFRALGYIMAQDRLVQMETMKKLAAGKLSELISFMALDIDRFLRTLNIPGISRGMVENMDAGSRRLLQQFVDGINEYIAKDNVELPFELMLLGGRPEPWRIEDPISLGVFMAWLLDSFWLADLMRERLIRKLGHKVAARLLPETSEICVPACTLGEKGCEVETLEPGEEIDWDFAAEAGGGEWGKGGFNMPLVKGSNNWTVAGDKTVTGKPILCSDPHVQHMVPSSLYMFHLNTPSFNVIGGTFSGLPVIASGHNEHCAWGPTSFYPDTRELYVETFESEDSDRYLYRGEWVEPEVRYEDVRVRFMGTRRLKVLETVHGPIIKRKGDRGLAMKWVAQDTSFDSLTSLLGVNNAGNWEEFRGALENFMGPSINLVYADVDGNIGYQAAAKVPIRAKGDGTIPCPGHEGDCEWIGYIPFEEMPTCFNPEEGFIATANNKVVTEDYDHLITKLWSPPYRQGRISELLRAKDKLSVEDMRDIQGDSFTYPGCRYANTVVSAAEGKDLEPAMREAVVRLKDWDHQARAESPAMTIYYFGWHHLVDLLLRHRLGDSIFEDYIYSWACMNLAIENILEEEDDYWLPEGFEGFDDVLLESLRRGLLDIEETLGTADQSQWEWGKVHSLTAFHTLGLFWPLDRIFNVGPIPRDGESETVNAAAPESDALTQVLARGTMGGAMDLVILPRKDSHVAYEGPAARLIADLSDWDNSLMVLDVGQSGHRLSPHYKDHFEKWQNVDYFPLAFSDERIEEFKESKLRLVPGK